MIPFTDIFKYLLIFRQHKLLQELNLTFLRNFEIQIHFFLLMSYHNYRKTIAGLSVFYSCGTAFRDSFLEN